MYRNDVLAMGCWLLVLFGVQKNKKYIFGSFVSSEKGRLPKFDIYCFSYYDV